jgi:hypothetical protein
MNANTIKLTTWNIEHFSRPLGNPDNQINQDRLMSISSQIFEMDPDILCILEAPGDLLLMQDWVNRSAGEGGLSGAYTIAVIPGTEQILSTSPTDVRKALQNLYGMKGNSRSGNQWIWFLVKNDLFAESSAFVQDPKVWQGMTGRTSWQVNYWGSYDTSSANHWRHPQTLVLKFGRQIIEVIGVHLKSKINLNSAFDDEGRLTKTYVDEALRARVKLATEAYDVRMYIERRFQQERSPHIIVCGDLNDGPGREFFERQYLFFDLVANIQGEVFFSSRYLNHALFDYDEHLRFSTEFDDKIERWALRNFENYNTEPQSIDSTSRQLIDHILFTQAFVGRFPGPKVQSKAGYMEHTIHEKINSVLTKNRQTSDHRPVSVEITM